MSKGVNFLVLCASTLGLCCAVSVGFGAKGISSSISTGAKTAAEKERAIDLSVEVIAEKAEHAAKLANLLNDRATVLVVTKQISPSTLISKKLKTMRSVFKSGDRVTVGGANGQFPPPGTIVVDGSWQVAILGDEGILLNPFNATSKQLPKMTNTQTKVAAQSGQFKDDDLYVTPAEKWEEVMQPDPATLVQPEATATKR